MTEPTRAAYLAAQGRIQRTSDARQSLAGALRLIRQADLSMRQLDGTPEWRSFLALAEKRNEEDTERRLELEDQLSSDRFLSPEAIAELRHELVLIQTRVQTRNELIGLPGAIQRASAKALKAHTD